MPRLSTSSKFYRSVKSNDSTAGRYVTFGSHATYLLNTAGGMSIWAKRGAWRSDGENIMELYGTGGYVRISMTGRSMSLTAFANSSTIASTSYTFSNNALESWHNVVVTWDSSSMDVYLDKTKVITVSGDKQLSFSANPTFYAGAGNAAGSGFFFDGYHTRAALYNAKLSQADVDKIWLTISPSSEVAAWDYTDTSGSTLTLTRGSGNNGTIVQGSIVDDVPIRPRQKLRNIPYAVGLTTGLIQASSNSGISGSGAWTMGGWVLINKVNGSATGYDLAFATSGGGTRGPYVGIDNGSFSLGYTGFISTSTVKAANYIGKWAHLAGSYSGGASGTFRLYLNGRQIHSETIVGTPSLVNGPFLLNNYLSSSSYQLYANFAEVFWATSALSETEIFNLAYGIATPTLAGYWKLDEGSGSVATDSSGSGSNGTIFSGTWTGQNVPATARLVQQNHPYSLLFNGTTQYGTKASMAFGSATKMVWDGWVYPADSGVTSQVLTSSDISGQAFEIQYNNTAIAASTFVFLVGVVGVYNYWVSEKVQPNKWYRLTCVYDSAEGVNTRTKVYINGKLSGAISSTNNVSPTFGTQTVELAARTSAAIYWKGYIGATRIYTGYAWTAADVLLAAQRNIYPSSGTLKASWGFTDGSGTTVTDSSGNGNNLTLTNSPTWVVAQAAGKSRLSIRSYPYALQFIRSSSSRVAIPYANLGTTLSFSAFIRPRIGANAGDIVGIMDTLIRISPTDIKFFTDGTLGGVASAAAIWEHNQLYQIGVTVTGTTVKFYVNGTLLATATASTGVDTTNTSNFIGYYSVSAQTFEGDIAEVAIWSRVLSDSEMADIWFRNILSATNLERWYKINDGSGSNVNDYSSNNQDGTITSANWITGFFGNRSVVS